VSRNLTQRSSTNRPRSAIKWSFIVYNVLQSCPPERHASHHCSAHMEANRERPTCERPTISSVSGAQMAYGITATRQVPGTRRLLDGKPLDTHQLSGQLSGHPPAFWTPISFSSTSSLD